MNRVFLIILAMLALCTDASAIVLIYTGVTRITEGPDSPIPARIRSYFLYEPSSRQVVTISFWRVGSQKFLSAPNPATLDVNAADLPDGRTATVISTALRVDLAGDDFINGMTFYRGTRSTLKITTAGLTTNQPRVFKGAILSAALSNTGTDSSFDERRLTATYNTTRSTKANDASQTIAQARAAIVAELNGLGFQ